LKIPNLLRRFARQRPALSGLWSRDVEHVTKRRSLAVGKLYTSLHHCSSSLVFFPLQIDSLTCLIFRRPSLSMTAFLTVSLWPSRQKKKETT